MSRIFVEAVAIFSNAKDWPTYFLFKGVGQFQQQTVRTISPNEVFSIGNQMGGYWAKPITYAGKKTLALVKLSGSEKGLTLKEIRRRCGTRRGFVLRSGTTGLWATSSGSARRGLLRPAKAPIKADPVDLALEECMLFKHVIEFGKGDLQLTCGIDVFEGRFFDCNEEYDFIHDGKQSKGERVEGCERCRVSSFSYCIVRTRLHGSRKLRIYLTPNADRSLVADKIRNLAQVA